MIVWELVLISIVPAFFLQTFIHEGSHALAALVHGMTIKSFKFWPHKTKDGRFWWGRVTYQAALDSTTDAEAAVRAAAPFFSSAIFLSITATARLLLQEPEPWLVTVLDVYITTVIIDMTRGFLQSFTRTARGDINKWARKSNVDRHTQQGISAFALVLLVGVWAIVIGRDLFTSLL